MMPRKNPETIPGVLIGEPAFDKIESDEWSCRLSTPAGLDHLMPLLIIAAAGSLIDARQKRMCAHAA